MKNIISVSFGYPLVYYRNDKKNKVICVVFNIFSLFRDFFLSFSVLFVGS